MRYLRWVGLMSSLLFVGVLGGLMAPLPSEAATTLTFQVDSTAAIQVPLTACAIPAGYTACFALQTGGTYSGAGPAGITRQFTIKSYLGTAPRLLVTDGSGLDNITLTTVEFAPVATTGWGSPNANIGVPGTTNYGEKHTLKVVVTHKFDKVANPKTVGTTGRYSFALRTSGMFKGGGQTGATASGDFVKLEGDGIFGSTSTTTRLLGPVPAGAPACDTYNSKASPLDVNYCPLKRTMGVTTALTSSFSTNPALQQVVTYPNYACDNGSGGCTPTVILRTTATVNGPDSFILSSSNDAAGGSCNLDAQGPPSSTSAVPCHDSKKGKKSLDSLISEYFAQQEKADAAAFAAEGAVSAPACEGEECVCQDPDTCPTAPTSNTGTIVIVKHRTPAPAPPETTFTFDFTVTGEGMSDFSLTPPNPCCSREGDSKTFSSLVTGVHGGSRTITETGFTDPPEGSFAFWFSPGIACSTALTPDEDGDTAWSVSDSDAGRGFDRLVVTNLEAGDTLTCRWFNAIRTVLQ